MPTGKKFASAIFWKGTTRINFLNYLNTSNILMHGFSETQPHNWSCYILLEFKTGFSHKLFQSLVALKTSPLNRSLKNSKIKIEFPAKLSKIFKNYTFNQANICDKFVILAELMSVKMWRGAIIAHSNEPIMAFFFPSFIIHSIKSRFMIVINLGWFNITPAKKEWPYLYFLENYKNWLHSPLFSIK